MYHHFIIFITYHVVDGCFPSSIFSIAFPCTCLYHCVTLTIERNMFALSQMCALNGDLTLINKSNRILMRNTTLYWCLFCLCWLIPFKIQTSILYTGHTAQVYTIHYTIQYTVYIYTP